MTRIVFRAAEQMNWRRYLKSSDSISTVARRESDPAHPKNTVTNARAPVDPSLKMVAIYGARARITIAMAKLWMIAHTSSVIIVSCTSTTK